MFVDDSRHPTEICAGKTRVVWERNQGPVVLAISDLVHGKLMCLSKPVEVTDRHLNNDRALFYNLQNFQFSIKKSFVFYFFLTEREREGEREGEGEGDREGERGRERERERERGVRRERE